MIIFLCLFFFLSTEPHISQSSFQLALKLVEDDLEFQILPPLSASAGFIHARQVVYQLCYYTLPALHFCLGLFTFQFRLWYVLTSSKHSEDISVSIYLSIYLSVYLSIYPPIYLLSIYLSIYLVLLTQHSLHEDIHSFMIYVKSIWKHWRIKTFTFSIWVKCILNFCQVELTRHYSRRLFIWD